MQTQEQEDGSPILGFHHHKKVDGIPNVEFSLVIIVTIVNHTILGLIVDDKSAYNLIYWKSFKKLGLREKDL